MSGLLISDSPWQVCGKSVEGRGLTDPGLTGPVLTDPGLTGPVLFDPVRPGPVRPVSQTSAGCGQGFDGVF